MAVTEFYSIVCVVRYEPTTWCKMHACETMGATTVICTDKTWYADATR